MPLKLFAIFGTRPEVIKLYPVLQKLRHDSLFEAIFVSTSQHRKMIDDLFQLFSIRPDYDLNIIQENQSLVDISKRALSGLDLLLKRHRADLVLIQGDTTTAFTASLAAFYNRIPVGHVEAGLRSFDKLSPYPEEINRKLISSISDLHFAPTTRNAENLHHEGVDPSNVFVTGNTVIDSLLDIAGRNRHTLRHYLPADLLNSQRMILVTSHRRENWGKPLEDLCLALRDISAFFDDIEIVYPVHLNPNVRKTVLSILANQKRIHLIDPLPYGAFVEAMVRAYLVITDSGGIQEEGPSLKKPLLVFRKVTERPEGLATGGVKLVGLGKEELVREASALLQSEEAYKKMIATHNPYGDGHAAERIVRAILYYFGRGPRPADFNPLYSA